MPTGEQMAQLSRPYQIALGAVLLFALVWFVALNGHGSSSTPSASTTALTPAPVVQEKAVVSGKVKHGAAGSSTTVIVKHAAVHASAPKKAASKGIPPKQAAVESELKQGKTVLVLFWNPKGADDVAVRKEVQAVEHKLGGKIAVQDALADQVGEFGSITKTIQVNQTPTILFVNDRGLTTTMTGFTDTFAIEQAIEEARQA